MHGGACGVAVKSIAAAIAMQQEMPCAVPRGVNRT